jgi:hypothetical protein
MDSASHRSFQKVSRQPKLLRDLIPDLQQNVGIFYRSVAGVTAKLESMESLRGYVYKSHHLEFFKHRAEWFEKATQPAYALWWIEVGHIPTVAEAKHRLNHYRIHGATQYSFWFSQPFPEPQKELLHA